MWDVSRVIKLVFYNKDENKNKIKFTLENWKLQ